MLQTVNSRRGKIGMGGHRISELNLKEKRQNIYDKWGNIFCVHCKFVSVAPGAVSFICLDTFPDKMSPAAAEWRGTEWLRGPGRSVRPRGHRGWWTLGSVDWTL